MTFAQVTELGWSMKARFGGKGLPAQLFDKTGERAIVAITCGGRVMSTPDGRHYDSNVYFIAHNLSAEQQAIINAVLKPRVP